MSRTIMFDLGVDRFFNDGTTKKGLTTGPFCVTYDLETLKIESVTIDIFKSCVCLEKAEQIELALMFLGGRDHVHEECSRDRQKFYEQEGICHIRDQNIAYENQVRRELKAGF